MREKVVERGLVVDFSISALYILVVSLANQKLPV